MTSTTAILPVGPMRDWCLTGFDSSPHDPFWDLCANTTRGHEADFTTICCDGQIIDTSFDIWYSSPNETKKANLESMLCCRQAGRNPGGLRPLPADYTHCARGDPTPLASMAATNTDKAQNFAVTYISASGGTADWTTQSTPSCLWVNTRNISTTTEITLPAAKITTLPLESGELYLLSVSKAFEASENATARATSTASRSTSIRSTATASSAGAQNAVSTLAATRASGWWPTLLPLVAVCRLLGVV